MCMVSYQQSSTPQGRPVYTRHQTPVLERSQTKREREINQSHASPQPSSSSSFLGFVSIFLAGAAATLGFAVELGLAVREIGVVRELLRPLGSGFLAFDCAASHPAKSGSPPSSYGTGLALGFDVALVGEIVEGALNGSSSFPHPSSSSSIAPHAS